MVSLLIGLAAVQSSTLDAKGVLDRAFLALGGREKLARIREVTATVAGHEYLPEQSERPTGPFLVTYRQGKRTLNLDTATESVELTMSGLVYGDRPMPRKFSIQNGTGRAASPLEARLSQLRMALGPERILFTAESARDLRLEPELTYNGTPHLVLGFHWGQIPVRILLRKADSLPMAVETRMPLSFPWAPWGDVTIRTRWAAWQLWKGGVLEPSQTVTEVNGYVLSDETMLDGSAKLETAPVVPVVAPKLVAEDAKPIADRYRASEIKPGIWQYQGPFNTFVIEQPEGLTVIEPVLSSAFGSTFLAQLQAKHPKAMVRRVVATDDAWPHFGGIRSFAAQGAELAILDLNQPIVKRILDAKHITFPDAWESKRRRAKVRLVKGATAFGSGPNRFVAYPIGGAGSERMMMLYFPEHKLLYGSDLLQRVGKGFFYAAYPKELVEAVQREKLDVTTVFGEHLPPTPWSDVTDFVKSM